MCSCLIILITAIALVALVVLVAVMCDCGQNHKCFHSPKNANYFTLNFTAEFELDSNKRKKNYI